MQGGDTYYWIKLDLCVYPEEKNQFLALAKYMKGDENSNAAK